MPSVGLHTRHLIANRNALEFTVSRNKSMQGKGGTTEIFRKTTLAHVTLTWRWVSALICYKEHLRSLYGNLENLATNCALVITITI